MRIIALMNQKGGVGKTTTAVNLGAALAEAGSKVCLVDLDPQSHLTINCGVDPSAAKVAPSTSVVLSGVASAGAAKDPSGLRCAITVPVSGSSGAPVFDPAKIICRPPPAAANRIGFPILLQPVNGVTL